jgi:endonuclease YncB( thermonuclease family)
MARKLSLIALAVALVLVAVPGAQARSGPCTSAAGAPRCTFWTGKVTFFADGDTIDVDIAGDGHGKRHIRLTGINAMELTRYSKYPSRRRGECHGVAATARLEQLIRRGHRRVRLAAQHASSRSGKRLRRQVSVRIGGRWVDVGEKLVAEGHALFLSNPDEWAWNHTYERLAQEAALAKRRLWNPRGCGPGAARGVSLGMQLRYDADGNDFQNVNGEWARISNPSGARVSLARWWFRDSAARRYIFPRHAAVPAHGSVMLRMGRGRSGGGTFFWGLGQPPFENPSYDRRAIGDGGYLFDPRGNLRSWAMYPCAYACG